MNICYCGQLLKHREQKLFEHHVLHTCFMWFQTKVNKSFQHTNPYRLLAAHRTFHRANPVVQPGKGSIASGNPNSLGIPQAATIAVGDNENDLSMVQWAGLGVAMGNAAPEV